MGIIFLTQMENTSAVVKKSTTTKNNVATKKASKKTRKTGAPKVKVVYEAKEKTYENVIIEGISKLKGPNGGVTVQSIIKYMKDQHEMENKQAFRKAIKKLKDNDKVLQGKNRAWLKLNFNPNKTDKEKKKKDAEKKKAADKKKKDASKKKAADKKKKDAEKKKAADKKKKAKTTKKTKAA